MHIDPGQAATTLRIDGRPAAESHTAGPADLERGVVLELAGRVVLLLHSVTPLTVDVDDFGLVGRAKSIAEVRAQIRRVAGHAVPVLLRGESGTGKELVAAAIHRASERAGGPFVSVNMAALVPSTAASAMFGHRKGAFTGAVQDSPGFFGKADGGSLFLDEIADTPADVQPALLRALDSGEVQLLGSEDVLHRDVRLIAATDADLEAAVEEGRFRLPLLQRLGGYELRLPPLRERREDIGRLLIHFLREHLADADLQDRLACKARGANPWAPATLFARAALAAWPGNVRQLRNAARQLVIDWGDAEHIELDPSTDRLFPPTSPASLQPPSATPASATPTSATPAGATPRSGSDAPRRLLRDISEETVIEALRRHNYRPGPAASELGVSRTSLYALIESSDRIRMAGELEADEIRGQLDAHDGDVAKAARSLEVSERGLRLRMKQLGI